MYGWYSDIETEPEILFLEYRHDIETGSYKVRNVYVPIKPAMIGISLTGEVLPEYIDMSNMECAIQPQIANLPLSAPNTVYIRAPVPSVHQPTDGANSKTNTDHTDGSNNLYKSICNFIRPVMGNSRRINYCFHPCVAYAIMFILLCVSVFC
jgi:hypothetical protein